MHSKAGVPKLGLPTGTGPGLLGTSCTAGGELKCNALESSPNHPPLAPVLRKIVFHETGPWCQKGWGLLF